MSSPDEVVKSSAQAEFDGVDPLVGELPPPPPAGTLTPVDDMPPPPENSALPPPPENLSAMPLDVPSPPNGRMSPPPSNLPSMPGTDAGSDVDFNNFNSLGGGAIVDPTDPAEQSQTPSPHYSEPGAQSVSEGEGFDETGIGGAIDSNQESPKASTSFVAPGRPSATRSINNISINSVSESVTDGAQFYPANGQRLRKLQNAVFKGCHSEVRDVFNSLCSYAEDLFKSADSMAQLKVVAIHTMLMHLWVNKHSWADAQSNAEVAQAVLNTLNQIGADYKNLLNAKRNTAHFWKTPKSADLYGSLDKALQKMAKAISQPSAYNA